jgi:aspartate/methionine/tyrosine aminotransferase
MKNRTSYLGPGGKNLFQEIKKKRIEAEATGIKITNLAIGQPSGPAFLSARQGAAEAVMSECESMHEYQDNGIPGCPAFPIEFAAYHLHKQHTPKQFRSVETYLQVMQTTGKVGFLPIPGIKPMLKLVIMACGAGDEEMLKRGGKIRVATMTEPGYPTPADQCKYLKGAGVEHIPLTLRSEDGFLPTISDLENAFPVGYSGLLMMNIPGNPGGQIATAAWMKRTCKWCAKRGIRIFNDGAYVALDHSGKNCTLTDIAMRTRGLSYAEAFSASKLIGNGTGWRIGVIIGSPDFIDDMKTIKGNDDSGLNAALAQGVLTTIRKDTKSIDKRRKVYEQRIELLVEILKKSGMILAVTPKAGFFTLWKAPSEAFGESVLNAEHFNDLMIKKTGVVGVPFGKDYIRYAVCSTEISHCKKKIFTAFKGADVRYY